MGLFVLTHPSAIMRIQYVQLITVRVLLAIHLMVNHVKVGVI